MRKLINTGSASKYPIKENTPSTKHTMAAISRRRGGFEYPASGCFCVFALVALFVAGVFGFFFLLLVCAILLPFLWEVYKSQIDGQGGLGVGGRFWAWGCGFLRGVPVGEGCGLGGIGWWSEGGLSAE